MLGEEDDERNTIQIVQEGDVVFFCPDSEEAFLHGNVCCFRVGFQCNMGSLLPLNFEDCLWHIVPQMPFQQSKQAKKLAKLSAEEPDEHLEELQKREVAEKAHNEETLSRIISSGGGPVTYGQVIQLRHCRTGKFLTATKQASEVDREAMQLSLEVDNASATGFLINARIKIRSEGDPVFYRDLINLTSTKMKDYIVHMGEVVYSKLDPEPKVLEANLRREALPLKICFFARTQASSQAKLRISLPFRFYHHESESFLQASANKQKQTSSTKGQHTPYLKRVLDGDYQSNSSFCGKAIWAVEYPIRSLGGELKWGRNIRIRHLSSGKFLAVNYHPIPKGGTEKFAPFLVEEKELLSSKVDPAQLIFSFKNLSRTSDADQSVGLGQDLLLEHKMAIKDKHGATTSTQLLYLSWAKEYKEATTKRKSDKKGAVLLFGTKPKDTDAFQIVEIDEAKIPIIQKLITFRDVADKYTLKLASTTAVIDRKEMFEHYGMLRELIYQIVEGEFDKSARPEDIGGPSDRFQQVISRHIKLINSIFHMIQAPLENGIKLGMDEETKKYDKRFRPIRKIHRLLFNALTTLFFEFPENEEYFASQTMMVKKNAHESHSLNFVNILILQVVYPHGAGDCLNTLISENKDLLDFYINDEMINNFRDNIATQGINEEYLEFFTGICSYLEQPILSNQQLLMKALVYDLDTNKKFTLQHFTKPFTLTQAKTTGQSTTFPSEWDQLQNGYKQVYVFWNGKDDWKPTDSLHLYYTPGSHSLGLKFETAKFLARSFKYGPNKQQQQTASEESIVRLEDFAWVLEPARLSKALGVDWVEGQHSRDSRFVADPNKEKKTQQFSLQLKLAEYFVAQMNMFAEMCLGRSRNVTIELCNMFPYAMVMSLIKNERLPYLLRAAYTNLLLRLWVDAFPHEEHIGHQQLPNLVWILTELKEMSVRDPEALPQFRLLSTHPMYNHPDEFLSYKKANKFDHFKRFFIEFCNTEMQGGQSLEERTKNLFFLKQLHVIKYLLSFGFYGKYDQLQDLCAAATKALCGRVVAKERKTMATEVDAGEEGGEEDDESDAAGILMDCKKTLCEVLLRVESICTNYRIGKVLHGFRLSQSKVDYSKIKSKKKGQKKYERLEDNPIEDLAVNERPENVFDDAFTSEDSLLLNFTEKADVPLDLVLLDLLMEPSNDLFNKAFGLFVNSHSKQEALQDNLKKIKLIPFPSIPHYGTHGVLELEMRLLRNYFQTYQSWGVVDDFSSTDAEVFKHIYKILNGMIKFLLLPELDQQEVGETKEANDHFSFDRDPSINFRTLLKKKVNKSHQDLFFYVGAQKVLLKSLDLYRANEDKKQPLTLRGVVRTSLGCLSLLVKTNRTIQEAVYPSLNKMTKLMKKDTSLGIDYLYMETLRYNASLCETLDENLYKLFAEEVASSRNVDLLEFFIIPVAPGGKLISKNQILGITVLTESFNITEILALGHEEEERQPGQLLETDKANGMTAKATKPKSKSIGQKLLGTFSKKKKPSLPPYGSYDLDGKSDMLTPAGVESKSPSGSQTGGFFEKSHEETAAVEFWMHLLRILSECAKGRENIASIGKLQKNLPSQFLIQQMGQLLAPEEVKDSANRDLLLSFTLFFDNVFLDTQLQEQRLTYDKDLQNVFKRMAEYLATIKLVGEVSNKFELSSESERSLLLGMAILSSLKHYVTIVMDGKKLEEHPDLCSKIASPLKTIVGFHGNNREARKLAFETLMHLHKEALEIPQDVLLEFHTDEEVPAQKKPPSQLRALQYQYVGFVQTIRGSANIKESTKKEKMEMVEIIENIEYITNPKKNEGVDVTETVQYLKESSKRLGRSKVISFKDLVQRMRKFLLEGISQKNKEASCTNIFKVLKTLLERARDKIKDAENSKTGSLESREIAEQDARKAHADKQTLLGKYGIMDAVFEAIQSNPAGAIGLPAFELGKEMLMFGNIKVQQALDKYAKTHDVNGRFFRNLRNRLRDAIGAVHESRKTLKHYPNFYQPPTAALDSASGMLSFMQQLCEGQFISMQQMLRAQPFNRKTYNLVYYGIELAAAIAKDRSALLRIDDHELQTVDYCLSFLIEVAQGPCPENQVFIADSQAIEVCDYIISTPKFLSLKKTELGFDVKLKAFTLLAACLEGRPDLVVEKALAQKLDAKMLDSALLSLFETVFKWTQDRGAEDEGVRSQRAKSIQSMSNEIQDLNEVDGMGEDELKEFVISCLDQSAAFLFFVRTKLSMLEELSEDLAPPKKFDKSKARIFEAYQGLKERLGYVEINWMDRIEILYFPMPTEAESLTQSTMQNFESTVELETRDGRVKQLMSIADGLVDEMMILDKLKSSWLYRTIKAQYTNIKYFNYFVAVCINILSLLGVTGTTFNSMRTKDAEHLLSFLSLVDMFGYFTLVMFSVVSVFQLSWRMLNRDFRNAVSAKLDADAFTSYEPLYFWFTCLVGYVVLCAIISVAFAQLQLHKFVVVGTILFSLSLVRTIRSCWTIPTNVVTRSLCCCYDVLFDEKIIGNLLLLLCTFLGFSSNVFFFTLLLCDIVSLSDDAKNVLLAVTKPGRALALTGVLFVIVILIFSTLGFILYGSGNFCEAGDCEQTPGNLYYTFLLVLDGGIRSGDIGSLMTGTTHDEGSVYVQRILFMLAFFIILGALLFNMVTGIIVDTFSSLREETASRLEKMNTESFISGISREDYEEAGLKFEKLIEKDQNLWNYIFFYLYLDKKDKSDLTGAERYVLKRISRKDNNWFPNLVSFQLQQTKEVEETGVSMETQMALANSNIEKLFGKVEEILKILNSQK